MLGDRTYDAIHSMGCPRHIVVRVTSTVSVEKDGVHVSRLSIDQVKLLGLQDGLFLRLGTFIGDVFGYGR